MQSIYEMLLEGESDKALARVKSLAKGVEDSRISDDDQDDFIEDLYADENVPAPLKGVYNAFRSLLGRTAKQRKAKAQAAKHKAKQKQLMLMRKLEVAESRRAVAEAIAEELRAERDGLVETATRLTNEVDDLLTRGDMEKDELREMLREKVAQVNELTAREAEQLGRLEALEAVQAEAEASHNAEVVESLSQIWGAVVPEEAPTSEEGEAVAGESTSEESTSEESTSEESASEEESSEEEIKSDSRRIKDDRPDWGTLSKEVLTIHQGFMNALNKGVSVSSVAEKESSESEPEESKTETPEEESEEVEDLEAGEGGENEESSEEPASDSLVIKPGLGRNAFYVADHHDNPDDPNAFNKIAKGDLNIGSNLPGIWVQQCVLIDIRNTAQHLGLDAKDFDWGVDEKGLLTLNYKGNIIATPEITDEGTKFKVNEKTIKKENLDGSDLSIKTSDVLPKYGDYGDSIGDKHLLNKASVLSDGITDALAKMVKERKDTIHVPGYKEDVRFYRLRDTRQFILMLNGAHAVELKYDSAVGVNSLIKEAENVFARGPVFSSVADKLHVKDALETTYVSEKIDLEAVREWLVRAIASELVAWWQYTSVQEFMQGLHANGELRHVIESNGWDELHDHARILIKRLHQLGGNVDTIILPETWIEASTVPYNPILDKSVDNVINTLVGAEQNAVNLYQSFFDFVTDKDVVTENLIQDILGDEQKHLADLQRLAESLGVTTSTSEENTRPTIVEVDEVFTEDADAVVAEDVPSGEEPNIKVIKNPNPQDTVRKVSDIEYHIYNLFGTAVESARDIVELTDGIYTPQDIIVSSNNFSVKFSIIDDGPGIAYEFANRKFKRPYDAIVKVIGTLIKLERGIGDSKKIKDDALIREGERTYIIPDIVNALTPGNTTSTEIEKLFPEEMKDVDITLKWGQSFVNLRRSYEGDTPKYYVGEESYPDLTYAVTVSLNQLNQAEVQRALGEQALTGTKKTEESPIEEDVIIEEDVEDLGSNDDDPEEDIFDEEVEDLYGDIEEISESEDNIL